MTLLEKIKRFNELQIKYPTVEREHANEVIHSVLDVGNEVLELSEVPQEAWEEFGRDVPSMRAALIMMALDFVLSDYQHKEENDVKSRLAGGPFSSTN